MSNNHRNKNSPPSDVVTIKNGYKSYLKNEVVLNGFSMSISRGTLYALIGSSGCGKTTVINCILGLLKLDKGDISVFRQSPAAVTHNQIGFMPQELSLYTNLTIWETLKYFGRLKQVEDLEEKIELLKELLFFNNKAISKFTTLVGNLSGGEQKQVSLAVALISKPKFVVLDEPTSGMDPLLRQRIWMFLINLVKIEKGTILLTTHYTDEIRKANVVGVIRNGKLLSEECPSKLLERYETGCLDKAILEIYKQPEVNTIEILPDNLLVKEITKIRSSISQKISFQRTRALIWKNLITKLRNKGLLLFISIMPAVIAMITCTTYKNGPKEIPLGIVNLDFGFTDSQENSSYILECVGVPLSLRFLDELSSQNIIHGKMFHSMESAKEAVTSGDTWGTLWFPENLTDCLTYRLLSGGLIALKGDDTNEIWNSSQIYVQMDQTNQLIYSAVVNELYGMLERFVRKLSEDCGLNENLGEYPLQYGDPPLVGSSKLGIIDYVTPGFSFGWLFFFPLISTSVGFIVEKRQGTFIRSLTSGVQIWEIFLANFATEFGVILVQSVSVIYVLVYVFQIGVTSHSTFLSVEIFFAWVIFILGGISGLCCGFLLGLLCSQETEAALLSIAIFFPNAFVSGIVWPLEGMPLVLRRISPFLPFTLPNESLRSLMNRKWEITHEMVWPGFAVIIIYIVVYISLIGIMIRKINRK